MKHTEFKKKFNDLSSDSILRDQVYTLNFPSEQFEASYDLLGLHKFVEKQNQDWNNSELNFNPRFRESMDFFSSLLNNIEAVIIEDRFRNENQIHSNIIMMLGRIRNTIMLSNSPKTLFLSVLNKNHPELFDGAFDGFTANIQQRSIPNKQYLKGLILATNYEMQDIDTLSLKESEEMSFIDIRRKFDEENNESGERFEDFFETTQKNSIEEIGKLKAIQEEWNNNFSKVFDEWTARAETEMGKSKAAATKLLKKSMQSKIDLEQTYREQMKFQVPAEYWKQRGTELNNEGHKFMRWLIALVMIGASMLFALLWLCPEDMLISIFSKEPIRAIRWSIIFITFISFLFFGIQAVKKAMFSSFHLARDAEEREKLTMFYLSLIKDTTITQEDRSLVLQSLFSRADTGMLKDDGNPTMPGLFDKIKV